MKRLGIDHVDRIRLAGAFGSHFEVKYATILGMISDCDLGGGANCRSCAWRRLLLYMVAPRDFASPRVQQSLELKFALSGVTKPNSVQPEPLRGLDIG
jgi:hypothetical protein